MPRLFAIGDIHGDKDGLFAVMGAMEDDGMDLGRDTLVFIGDYVDGFEHSASVVEYIRFLQRLWGDHVIALKGNHEDMFSTAMERPGYDPEFQNWWTQGGKATYASYDVPKLSEGVYGGSAYLRKTPELESHLEWVGSLPTMYETDQFYFVHAGFWPDRPVEETRDFDRMWLRQEFLYSDYDWGKVVVHGHTPVRLPEVKPNRININTRSRSWGFVTGVELLSDQAPIFYRPPAFVETTA